MVAEGKDLYMLLTRHAYPYQSLRPAPEKTHQTSTKKYAAKVEEQFWKRRFVHRLNKTIRLDSEQEKLAYLFKDKVSS